MSSSSRKKSTQEAKEITFDIPPQKKITKPSTLGSKLIKSKDVIDTDISLFTTQKKRILDFAIENQTPSKFVFPIYDSNREHNRSDISVGLETIDDFIKRESKIYDVIDLVQRIREKEPRITQTEALYYISTVVDNDNDFFRKASKISIGFEDPERFNNDKLNWAKDEFPKLIERDIADREKLEIYFQNIQSIDPVQTSDMTITKMTIEFDIQLEDDNDTILNVAPDLFANMKTSYDVPFVQYNDQQFSKYKVFSGDTFETRPPFKFFQHHFSKFEDKNMIYMILLADPGTNVQEYTKSSYIPVSIDLNKNILSFKYFVLMNRPENEIITSILNIFPGINLINRREKNYGAHFNIYNTYIREDSFLDILISEPFVTSTRIFSAVLFADENEKPISEKKKLKLYYDTNIGFEADTIIEYETKEFGERKERTEEISRLASLGFYMTQYQSGINDASVSKGRYTITEFQEGDNNIIGTKDSIVKSLFLDLKTPYITVSISKAVNRFILFQFMNVYARLLSIYNEVRDVYEKEYDSLIPELKDEKIQEEELSLILKPSKMIDREKIGKINLSKIAPEIFTKSYSRDCQYKNQPIVVSETEIDSWKNRKIQTATESIERPVKQLGDYNFVCPTDIYPYVEFKQNLDERREFDVYPCCYQSPQSGVRQRERGSSKRSKDPIKTNKIMGEGGNANLPTSIEEMLQGSFVKPVTFYRTGTLVSPSSFLACVCLAMEDKNYIKLKTLEEKEKYIQNLRKQISQTGNFLLTSSELFDVSEKDRVLNFSKLEEFLDPSLYYRVIEELFNINIFVFTGSLPKPNIEPIYSLEVSRFSSIPIHSFKKDAPTLLIYKHWGAETDHLEYPQCELIIARLEDKDATLFSSEIAKYLLKAYFISAEVYGRLFIPERSIFEKYNSKLLYQLLESDFIGSFNQKNSPIHAIGQMIDEKGKLCGIQLRTPMGNMTMGVPPLPPQNLPLINEIEKPKLSKVLKVFKNEPSGYSYEGDNVVAVWFRLLTLEFGIQIPVKPESKDKIKRDYRKLLPSVPENRFILETKLSEIQRLLKLQRDVNMIVQLIRWIFLIMIEKEDFSYEERLDAATIFLNKIVKEVSREEKDSALIYDFSRLPRKLPTDRSNIQVILQEISKYAPSFTDGDKILISGKLFYERVRESLEHYVNLKLPIIIPNYLDGYYETSYDYPKIPKTLLFLSDIDFKRWLKQAIEVPISTYPVLYSLKGKLSDLEHPYLYVIEMSKPSIANPFGEKFLCIIQNVPFVNSKTSALENCIRWRDIRINHPKISSLPISRFRNYKIFTISQSETFEVIEDMSDEEDTKNTIFILIYPGTEKYASILPI
jgi:hypothetical protein